MPHEITHLCLFRISYEKQVLKEVAGRNQELALGVGYFGEAAVWTALGGGKARVLLASL